MKKQVPPERVRRERGSLPGWWLPLAAALCWALALLPGAGWGAEPAEAPAEEAEGGSGDRGAEEAVDPRRRETTVTDSSAPFQALPEGRATSRVQRSELERRLPRSAPDALRYEPGVFVQQTAHGQGSAFLRGLTGQQTVLLFDGIRLNTSTWRQGPNQYFFTLDSQTLDSIEVLRGGASTRYGSDALGGVVLARPQQPALEGEGGWVRPRLRLRGATADSERGGRVQLEAGWGGRVGFLGGVGGRRVGLLQGAGPVLNPVDGNLPEVPRLAEDGRTQLGTGFDELSADGRLLLRLAPGSTLTLAGYLYRQYDAPRTDQCPPPAARYDECLRYERQFRTLAYAAWEGARLGPLADSARATLSWQQQHERRRGERPASYYYSLGEDDVDTLGLAFRARARPLLPPGSGSLVVDYGVDTYVDLVRSLATVGFTDLDISVPLSRGQYLNGSWHVQGGAFLEGALALPRWGAVLRAGVRSSWVAARAPGDTESGTSPVDRSWWPLVGHVGAEWKVQEALSVLASVDHSFRSPNLDDLTSRQQTGPGFQFENPRLGPERATTLELGARLRTLPVSLQVWGFAMLLEDAIGRRPREAADCPPGTPQCQSSWSRFQLVNAREPSVLWGAEAAGRLRLPWQLAATATVAWAWGEGPNLGDPPSNPSLPYARRVPLSRVPPLNGTVELQWAHPLGLAAGAALRWAGPQTRLAVADYADARIPLGGTPGFAVVDARLSYRHGNTLVVALVLENLLDSPFRYHGSSVNGPARGATVSLEGALP